MAVEIALTFDVDPRRALGLLRADLIEVVNYISRRLMAASESALAQEKADVADIRSVLLLPDAGALDANSRGRWDGTTAEDLLDLKAPPRLLILHQPEREPVLQGVKDHATFQELITRNQLEVWLVDTHFLAVKIDDLTTQLRKPDADLTWSWTDWKNWPTGFLPDWARWVLARKADVNWPPTPEKRPPRADVLAAQAILGRRADKIVLDFQILDRNVCALNDASDALVLTPYGRSEVVTDPRLSLAVTRARTSGKGRVFDFWQGKYKTDSGLNAEADELARFLEITRDNQLATEKL